MNSRIATSVLLIMLGTAAYAGAQTPPPRKFEARRLAAAGIRTLVGRRVQILTDLPSSSAVDELPQVFDAAIPEWCAYFQIQPSQVAGQWLACVIQDRQRFASLGLLPEDNPQFVNGYARGYELWLMDQPSDYYRRHLLLHEGTHAFMQTQVGGAGPGWYMEGMAELLGTHRWQNGRLKLGVMPSHRDEVPMWGRIKLIRDAAAARKPWPIDAVLAVDNRRVLSTDQYAWTWALAQLLDTHPEFRARFRSLKTIVSAPDFTAKFRAAYAEDWPNLLAEWEAFTAQLDYGYDIERAAIAHQPAQALGAAAFRTSIAADRGWQSTGCRLQAGKNYRVTASGSFKIADDGQPWSCEPNGVTLEYHDGKPLGVLLGALRPLDGEGSSFSQPLQISAEATLKAPEDAVLYLRVNDSPAKLDDNAGAIDVKIESAPSR